VPDGDPDNDKTLNYIGRLLAFAYATDTRVLAQQGLRRYPAYELWFSFISEDHKQRFLQIGVPGLNCASGVERDWTRRAYGTRKEVRA